MFDYCFKYASWANDFYSDPFEVVSPDPRVAKVTMEVNKPMRSLETSVYFSGNYTSEEAQICADDVALWAINQLSRYTDRYFGELQFLRGSQISTNEDGARTITEFGSKATVRVGLSADFTIGYEPAQQAEILKRILQQGRKPIDENFAAYRAALVADDAVARFMNLYLILLSYHNEDFNRVDNYIKMTGKRIKINLDVQDTLVTKSDGSAKTVNETAFTRLRNQVTHNRGVAPASTRAEMEKHLYNLMRLVKQCLEENAPESS